MSRRVPPPPPARPNTSRQTPDLSPTLRPNELANSANASPLNRHSTINVQSSFKAFTNIEIPEPPQTEAGKWTFHSQKELPPPPPFEKKLRRYPTGAETGCSIPIDLSHLHI